MENRKSRTSRRSARFAWLVVIVGLLSATALALYGILRGGYGRDTHADWLRLSNELRKNGEPIYFAEVKPPDVLDEQNFFAADVFAGVAEGTPRDPTLQRAVNPGHGITVAELLTAATKGDGASLESISTTMQRVGLVKKTTDFLLAGDRVRAGIRALGLDFLPLATAADRPGARFPIDYSQPFPSLPHLRYLEALGDWLAIRAVAQLSTGDSDAAEVDLLLIGRLADSIAAEPFLASQRIRRRLLGLFVGCVRVGAGWGAWTAEQRERFSEAMEKVHPIADFTWAIRGERAQLNTAINSALSGQKPAATDALQGWLGNDLVQLKMRTLRARQVEVNQALQAFIDSLAKSPEAKPAATPVPDAEFATERLEALQAEAQAAAQLEESLKSPKL
jgi:hypothetical protein